ncbi:hypothetical protein ACHAXN_000274 [Cyclotella atomus]
MRQSNTNPPTSRPSTTPPLQQIASVQTYIISTQSTSSTLLWLPQCGLRECSRRNAVSPSCAPHPPFRARNQPAAPNFDNVSFPPNAHSPPISFHGCHQNWRPPEVPTMNQYFDISFVLSALSLLNSSIQANTPPPSPIYLCGRDVNARLPKLKPTTSQVSMMAVMESFLATTGKDMETDSANGGAAGQGYATSPHCTTLKYVIVWRKLQPSHMRSATELMIINKQTNPAISQPPSISTAVSRRPPLFPRVTNLNSKLEQEGLNEGLRREYNTLDCEMKTQLLHAVRRTAPRKIHGHKTAPRRAEIAPASATANPSLPATTTPINSQPPITSPPATAVLTSSVPPPIPTPANAPAITLVHPPTSSPLTTTPIMPSSNLAIQTPPTDTTTPTNLLPPPMSSPPATNAPSNSSSDITTMITLTLPPISTSLAFPTAPTIEASLTPTITSTRITAGTPPLIMAPTTPVTINLKPLDSSKQCTAGRRRNVPPSRRTEMCKNYAPERA